MSQLDEQKKIDSLSGQASQVHCFYPPTAMPSELPQSAQAKAPSAPTLPSALIASSTHTFPEAIRSALAAAGQLDEFNQAVTEDGHFHARLELQPWMPLSIETIGRACSGANRVAVMHWFIQNGDLMRDPEIVFEVYATDAQERWVPCELTQHPVGYYGDAYNETGMVLMPQKARGFLDVANKWARNIHEQGWTSKAALYREPAEHAEQAEAAEGEELTEEPAARRR